MLRIPARRYMCLRLWPSQDDAGEPAPAPRQLLPPDHGALLCMLRPDGVLMRSPQRPGCLTCRWRMLSWRREARTRW